MSSQSFQGPSFKVYARWRPLSLSEQAGTEIERNTLQHSNTNMSVSLASRPVSGRPRSWKSAPSFTHIFEPEASNNDVFETIVAPAIPQVLSGATCNFFAYGHSGSGKTHTIIGYDYDRNENLGLSLAVARDLMAALDRLNADCSADEMGGGQSTFGIGLRLYELRKKSAFDLLNKRTECFVREGPDGQTHIRGQTELLDGGKVRVRPIVTRPYWTLEDLRRELLSALDLRSTGSSTVHDQSSRTHAVLELEVVNKDLLEARDLVIERQSELVPVAKRATDIYLEESMKSFIKTPEGKYIPNPDHPLDQTRIDAAEATKGEFEARLRAAEDHVTTVLASRSHPSLGGKFVFVDLAGSEYFDAAAGAVGRNITPQDRQEGRQINSDLFALKEVIRARAVKQTRIPYRSAPLTMVLREHFTASAESSSAMILTISPSAEQYTATANTLKYGNLVGVAGGDQMGMAET
ncbi:uncharacterized protein A1O5_08273 [Cladophialophora psammophila CBS 110553]|uniref:Kinesin-like protein n=1 Tax=Cladophialophora psammophila CBS 110553 TaxID=1182543 RepID=W9WTX9_9EURO|nr:uncharacterized protein A1O5_08273 [Cladophialophora psammophila CBS 110553]EXJ68480.1 hypothetical protein A1O5_08273 [Cladophialophora psammophila CBS 110553]